MKLNSPCLDCPLRKTGCHSECKAYKEYRVKQDEESKLNHITSVTFCDYKSAKQKAQCARWKQLHPFKRNK